MKNDPHDPRILELCVQHGITEVFIDSGIYLCGEGWFNEFIKILEETTPGTRTRDEMNKLALDRAEQSSGVSAPAEVIRPFRFCSP